mmetsp:Transcript_6598/g.8366  ORF Transcript_6598/g.8366 Transcript_6598/m.8366 type:complete len:161 (+) Transcript_6598:206-688(+)
MTCCCIGSKYHPETASDDLLVSVTVPPGYKPGQTIQVNSPDASHTVNAIIPKECDYEGSIFMVQFPKQGQATKIISPKEELKICVQAPMGARIGSMMYAPVPGDSSRVLPIRIPSRKVRKFYVGYTMEQTILRSDVPRREGTQKQNWHDNRLAVMAPLFF